MCTTDPGDVTLPPTVQGPDPLTTLPGDAAGAAAPPDAATPGGYEVLGEIAAGGMGVVYRARQLPVGRIVALKRIHAALASPSILQRFRLEAEAVATLDHPNIVPIYEVGVQAGQPFFSMKLIEGGNLTSWLAEHPNQLRDAVAILAVVARAVHHAHQRGILHRDLKPGNILIDRDGTPYVTDFGLAKRLAPGPADSDVTHSGTIVGTPSYMAPEQAESRKDLTTAVDVYSLGVILYEMLTGRPPFTGDSPLDVLLKVVEQEPPPPRLVHPGADRDLEAICLRCLDKNPARRLGSAGELADDLERWLAGRPVRARLPSLWERGVKWARRRPAVAALSALVIVLLGLGLAGAAWTWRQQVRAHRQGRELSANLALRESWHLGDEGRIGPAMLWTVRALELSSDEELQQTARANLAAWYPRLSPLRDVWQAEQGPAALDFDAPTGPRLDPLTGERLPGTERDQRLILLERLLGAALPEKKATATAWSNDRRQVAVGSPSGTILVSTRSDNPTRLLGPRKAVLALAFSPDGRRLVSGHAGGQIALWDLASGKPLLPQQRHEDDVAVVRFSPDGRRVVSGGDDDTARLWDAASGKMLARLEHQDFVRTLAFGPDGTTVLTGSHDRTARLWDAVTGRRLGTLLPHRRPVLAVTFADQARRLVSYSRDGVGRVWEAARTDHAERTFATGGDVYALALHEPTGRLLVGGVGTQAHLLDARTVRPAGPALLSPDEVWAVAFHPDGRTAYTGGPDGQVRAWDLARRQVVRAWKGAHYVRGLAMHPEGRRLLVGRGDRDNGSAELIDLDSGKVEEVLARQGPVYAVAFAIDGERFATSTAEGKVQVWQTATRRPVGEPLAHATRVAVLAFGPGGLLATGSTDQYVRLWDDRGRPFGQPMFQRGAVWGLAIRHDGKFLAAGGRGQGVQLWDVRTTRRVGPLLRHDAVVWALGFAGDGAALWTGCGDHRVRRWQLPTLELEGGPERLRLWCQVVTGLELDGRDNIAVLDIDAWRQRRDRLEELGGPPL